jgi:hypothetical protein
VHETAMFSHIENYSYIYFFYIGTNLCVVIDEVECILQNSWMLEMLTCKYSKKHWLAEIVKVCLMDY